MPVQIHCIIIDLSQDEILPPISDPVLAMTGEEEAKKIFKRDVVINTLDRCPCASASPLLVASASESIPHSSSSYIKDKCRRGLSAIGISFFKNTGSLSQTGKSPSFQSNDRHMKNTTTQSIIRFLKIHDQYIAFTSILLKSYLYNCMAASIFTCKGNGMEESDRDCKSLSAEKLVSTPKDALLTMDKVPKQIVILPRTKYGKPYLPSSKALQSHPKNSIKQPKEEDQEQEKSWTPFSLSHHYPFVGLAYFSGNDNMHSSLILGFDIVTFDAYARTKSLYASSDEFLECFRGSFTAWEWSQIRKSNHDSTTCSKSTCGDGDPIRVKEMLLRWAMKESYTKGMGTGLGTEFGSFAIRIIGVDSDVDNSSHHRRPSMRNGAGIFDLLRNAVDVGAGYKKISLTANIYHEKEPDTKCWEFIFIPLTETGGGDKDMEKPTRRILGCACICTGPTESVDPISELNMCSMTMQDLIEYHTNIPFECAR